jgi:hypothetical protein
MRIGREGRAAGKATVHSTGIAAGLQPPKTVSTVSQHGYTRALAVHVH